MIRVRKNSWLPPKLVLALLLLVAQGSALAHVFEHDLGSLQNQACAMCVATNQLDTGCFDLPAIAILDHQLSSPTKLQTPIFKAVHILHARQRGPPTSL